jgi:glycosyltransferase involved in cell wall biosynthesis
VSVLVPARNEEAIIARCLESLLTQDYPDFEIIVANDRSTDRTEQIVRELAAKNPRLRLLNVEHLPEGWTGKTHALHFASKQARGEWLVFTDADTDHLPTCLRRAMSDILKRNVDLFSTVGRMENKTFWEKALTPLLGLLLMIWYPPTIVNSRRFSLGFANGQFIIVRRKTYDAIGGHESVRGELLEDIAMGKRAKRMGFQLRLVLAPHLYTTRMYPSFRRFFFGWSRIMLHGLNKSPLRLGFFILFGLVFSIYLTLLTVIYGVKFACHPTLAPGLIFAACLALYVVKVWTVSNTYFVSGGSRRYALLNPINTIVVLAILGHAFYKAVNPRSPVEWRGTQYSTK